MPFFVVVKPVVDAEPFGLFICRLSNGDPWMETCLVDNGDGLRFSKETWGDFCSAANDFDPELKSEIPDPETRFSSDLFEWSAATFSYDGERVDRRATDMRLPMAVPVRITEIGLACRIGVSDIETYFNEQVSWETDTTIFQVSIAKPGLECVDRDF